MNIIKTILIDLGDVIVYYDLDKFGEYICNLGVSPNKDKEYFMRYKKEYDEGIISSEEFWQGYIDFTGIKSPINELANKIKEIIRLDQDMLGLIKKLKGEGTKIIIVSNIDENTFCGIKKLINLKDYFDAVYVSFQHGTLKSDIRFFTKIINEHKLNPAETLFIDDNEENIKVAQKANIKTYLFRSFEDFQVAINSGILS